MRAQWLLMASMVACAGDETSEGGPDEPIESYGCTEVEVGTILDVALTREDAKTIKADRTSYRVNIANNEAGYVAFEGTGTELTLLLSYTDTVHAWWNGEERVAFDAGTPNPNCEEDLPVVHTFTPGAGRNWLEVGPSLQGSVWMMLGE